MTDGETVVVTDRGSSTGLILGIALAAVLLLGAWLIVAGGIGRPSIRANDHTNDAVPTVDLRAPARPAIA